MTIYLISAKHNFLLIFTKYIVIQRLNANTTISFAFIFKVTSKSLSMIVHLLNEYANKALTTPYYKSTWPSRNSGAFLCCFYNTEHIIFSFPHLSILFLQENIDPETNFLVLYLFWHQVWILLLFRLYLQCQLPFTTVYNILCVWIYCKSFYLKKKLKTKILQKQCRWKGNLVY